MSFKLYKLKSGSMRRKVSTGGSVSYPPGTVLVPSPSEFAFNKFRLEPAGEADDDSPEVQQAILNTNKIDHPNFGKTAVSSNTLVVTAAAKAADVDDIRAVKDGDTAKAVIASADNEDVLDKFLTQESDNKPRVRKFVLQAIELRRAELQEAASSPS